MGSLKTTIDQEKLIFAYALKKPQYLLSMGGDFYNNPEIQYLAMPSCFSRSTRNHHPVSR